MSDPYGDPFAGMGDMNLTALIRLIRENASLAGRQKTQRVGDAYGRMGAGNSIGNAWLPGRTAFDVSKQASAGAIGASDQYGGRDLQKRLGMSNYRQNRRSMDIQERQIPKFSVSIPGGGGLSI